MRRFRLIRNDDISGVSGTGFVAEVVEFESGKVALSFLLHTAGVANVIIYDSLEDVLKVHGHGGATILEEYDE